MDINYYDKHQEEFEAVTLALKANLEEVWGSSLKNQGESCNTTSIRTTSRRTPQQKRWMKIK